MNIVRVNQCMIIVIAMMVVAMSFSSTAAETKFTIVPDTPFVNERTGYTIVVDTDESSDSMELNITLPVGFSIVAPTTAREQLAEVNIYGWIIPLKVVFKSSNNFLEEVDVTATFSDSISTTIDVDYNLGGKTVICSSLFGMSLSGEATLPTLTSVGYLNASVDNSLINFTKVSIDIDQYIQNPSEPGDYEFIVKINGDTMNVVVNIVTPTPTPTPERIYFRGGAAAPRDTDGDGISNIDEMLAGTDLNDPCDPNSNCNACLAIRPVVSTPTPTPEDLIEILTPTPEPSVTSTPIPAIPDEPKKMNKVLIGLIVASAGGAFIMLLYLLKKKRENEPPTK